MADKTIGELTEAAAIDDTSKIPGEQQGSAVYYTGRLLKDYAVAAAEQRAEVVAGEVAQAVWNTADKSVIVAEVLTHFADVSEVGM